jgi:16S rRNA (guanine1207-N2)-methyltransferase
MTPDSYWSYRSLSGGALTKPGIPGFPHLEPSQDLLLEAIEDLGAVGTAVDLSARGGAVVLRLRELGWIAGGTDSSASSLTALSKLVIADDGGSVGLTCRILSGERGNARVFHELEELWGRTAPGGVALLAGDKDKGFDRYLKTAVSWFGAGEVVKRGNGFRVARVVKTKIEPPPMTEPSRFTLEARGRALACIAYPGVFAAGKLDAASAVLLAYLPAANGKTVLDIGAGYGALGGFLALEGATVTMLEHDALSVQSCRETLVLNELPGTVLHSDVDATLETGSKFDWVVMNPPFHVGRDLKLDVALEFIAAADRHLRKGGEAWLVANHFLPYEAHLAGIGTLTEVVKERGFKLLHVKKT